MSTTPFDHLVTESIRKGFYGAVKPNVPTNSLLLTTGCNPYVGYYHASEASTVFIHLFILNKKQIFFFFSFE